MFKPNTVTLNSSTIRQLALISCLVILFSLILPATALAGPPRQEGTEDCAICHKEETAVWQNSPHAQAVEHGGPGATCKDCHYGEFFENHPAREPIPLVIDSSICEECHADTFEQWEGSHHAENGVQCIGCHLSHSQDFRLTDDALCASCHRDRLQDFSHTSHSESYVTCADCHLVPLSGREATDGSNSREVAPSHDFSGVPSENCIKCHKQNIHTKEDALMHCGECHPETTAAWQNSPHARATDGEGHKLGATCQDCHGAFVENHPKKGAMRLTTDSFVCGECHTTTFDQWSHSSHAQSGVECIGCHLSHSQDFRLTDEELCGSCHRDRMEDYSHSAHSSAKVTCIDCHLAPDATHETALAGPGQVSSGKNPAPNHNFSGVPAENCSNCHKETIHEVSTYPVDEEGVTQLKETAERVPELTDRLESAEQANESLQTMSLVSLGIGLGVGGILGVIFVLVVGYLTQRRTQ